MSLIQAVNLGNRALLLSRAKDTFNDNASFLFSRPKNLKLTTLLWEKLLGFGKEELYDSSK